MVEAEATARYVRTSAQKAKLVLDLIRGRDVNQALATLRFARKVVAGDVEKVLRSAIANAQQREGFGGDIDRLFVLSCYANQGPSMKRIRPAPMGRAFRILKRTAHLTVRVAERPAPVSREPAPGTPRARPAVRSTGKTGQARGGSAPGGGGRSRRAAPKRRATPKKTPKKKKTRTS